VATLRGTVPLWTPETPVRTDRSSESDHRFARCPAVQVVAHAVRVWEQHAKCRGAVWRWSCASG